MELKGSIEIAGKEFPLDMNFNTEKTLSVAENKESVFLPTEIHGTLTLKGTKFFKSLKNYCNRNIDRRRYKVKHCRLKQILKWFQIKRWRKQ